MLTGLRISAHLYLLAFHAKEIAGKISNGLAMLMVLLLNDAKQTSHSNKCLKISSRVA